MADFNITINAPTDAEAVEKLFRETCERIASSMGCDVTTVERAAERVTANGGAPVNVGSSYASAKIHEQVQRAQWAHAMVGGHVFPPVNAPPRVPVYARPDGTASTECTPGSVLAGTLVTTTAHATKPLRAGEVAVLGGNVEAATVWHWRTPEMTIGCDAQRPNEGATVNVERVTCTACLSAYTHNDYPAAPKPEPIPGSLAWIKSIAGEDAEVTEEPALGRVTVLVPVTTPSTRARHIEERLTREGPSHIVYGVFYKRPAAPPPYAVVTVQLPGYVDKIEATIAVSPPPCGGVCPADLQDAGKPCTLTGSHDTHRTEHSGWRAGVPVCGECKCINRHTDDCPVIAKAAREERRAREAPLVALVAAVPEGLDPVGWRAAVLCAVEDIGGNFRGAEEAREFGVHVEAAVRCTGTLLAFDDARAAYQRAIAPHKAPPPERKGATWRDRGTIYTQHADDAEG